MFDVITTELTDKEAVELAQEVIGAGDDPARNRALARLLSGMASLEDSGAREDVAHRVLELVFRHTKEYDSGLRAYINGEHSLIVGASGGLRLM